MHLTSPATPLQNALPNTDTAVNRKEPTVSNTMPMFVKKTIDVYNLYPYDAKKEPPNVSILQRLVHHSYTCRLSTRPVLQSPLHWPKGRLLHFKMYELDFEDLLAERGMILWCELLS